MTKYTATVTNQQCADLLRLAFDHICDPNDWKAEIDAIVPAYLADVYAHSVLFMTATEARAEATDNPKLVRLKANGYRNGPAFG